VGLRRRRDEAHRVALAAGAPGAADAVHVVVGGARQVVVDDQRQGIDVQAAGRHVGGHQHLQPAVLEVLQRAHAGPLAQAPVEGRRREAGTAQLVGHVLGRVLAGHEDQHTVVASAFDQMLQQPRAARFVDHDGALADVGPGRRRGGDADVFGVAQPGGGQRLDRRRQRGRHQHRLALGRQQAEDLVELVGEAECEQAVGLVEHQRAHRAQCQRVVAHQVEQPAGRGHDDVGAAAQGHHLRVDGHAAEDDGDLRQAGQLVGQAAQGVAHLQRQLARGNQHQAFDRPGCARPALEPALQQRQREGERLARAGARLRQHVAPGQQRRDRRGLHGGGLRVAERLERVVQRRGEAEGFERHGGIVGAPRRAGARRPRMRAAKT
jgi:hypothetical protein